MKNNTALLLIDVQRGFDETSFWGRARNNPDAEQKMEKLLACWRKYQLPVIHIKHDSVNPASPLRPDQEGNQIRAEVAPQAGEKVYGKRVNSAFIGTDLEAYLRKEGINSLVLCGMTTDHCVSTTARMGANLGIEVTVVEDATATFDRDFQDKHFRAEDIHQYHLLSLQNEFAEIVSSDQLLERLDKNFSLH